MALVGYGAKGGGGGVREVRESTAALLYQQSVYCPS